MIGSRGIPASYSGFETAVENLSVRLVKRGHRVTVYCRSTHVTYPHVEYRGVRLLKLPTIPSKHLDTLVHTFLSALHVLFSRYDVVYVCGVGNSLVAWIPRLAGKRVVINVDGADWERKKWGWFARWFLKASERWALVASDAVIADSRVVQEYYRRHYRAETVFIPYGAAMAQPRGRKTLKQFGLRPKQYILFVGRLVPENGAHELLAAYSGLATKKKLVIVGDAPYAAEYIRRLKSQAGRNIIFTGYVFGPGYQELSAHAYLYVLASGVGGTHPVLVEQMAAGNAIIAIGSAANRETLGPAGLFYDPAGGAPALRRELGRLLARPAKVRDLGRAAKARARTHYSWDAVTRRYETLFLHLTARS
jgi:glycosyltransferase involved in cell wall biosynthesis